MEIVQREIRCKPDEPVVLAPLGDIQWAGRPEGIAYRQLEEYIARAMERKAWFCGMGDYIDAFSPSNRQRLRGAALYDTAQEVIEDKTRELVFDLYQRLLQPTTGRWLFLLEGHHWAPLATGETSDQYLCQLLKAPFVGTTVYLGLHFPLPHYGTRTVTLWAHHGAGGGQKVHAPVLKLENLSTNWDADILLVGHMTKRALGVIQRCSPVWAGSAPSLRHREIHLVGVGGWMKGYQEFSRQGVVPRGSYVEQKMLAPVALGAPLITITPHLRRESVPGKGQRERRHWEPRIVVES